MNIPNFLTLFRILLIPLLVIFLLEGKATAALWVFVAAGVTDALDGFLARVLRQKTDFGAFLDPIADKLLLITSYITLSVLGVMPNWLTVIVVSRDVIIVMGIGILMLYSRSFSIKPTIISKITTFLQLITITFYLGRQYLVSAAFVEVYLLGLTAFFTIVSGVHYIIFGFRLIGKPESIQRK
jgi:cardiolipin synthase